MDLSLRQIFERARAAQEWVPATEADLLFAAALRKAVDLGVPLSPAKVMLREGGVLELVLQDMGPEPAEYLAPEAAPGEPRRTDARAQVYSAGAFGYELFTGLPPPRPPHGPGPELTGPLGDVVRVAMAQDRRERFSDMQQLFEAVSTIEPSRSPPEERGLLAGLLARVKRWEERAQNAAALAVLKHEYQRLEARLAAQELATARMLAMNTVDDRIAVLEGALKAVRAEAGAAATRLQQNLRELVEDKRRDDARAREEKEQSEARLLLHPPRPAMMPVLGAAVAAAVIASLATVLLLNKMREADQALANPTFAQAALALPPAAAVPAPPAPALPAAPAPALPVAASPSPASPLPGASAAPSLPPAAPVAPSLAPPAPAALVDDRAVVPSAPTPKPIFAPAVLAKAAPAPAAASAPTASLPPKKRARALLDHGDTALEHGHPEAAISAFQNALEADSTLAEAHRGLGMAYAMQGADVTAKREYEVYLNLAPKATDAPDIRAAISELNTRSKLAP